MCRVTLTGFEEDATGALVPAADPNAVFNWTQNGLAVSNGLTGNSIRSARRTAFYIADQIETQRWSFDFGARVERLDGEVKQFGTSSFQMGNDPSVNNLIESRPRTTPARLRH